MRLVVTHRTAYRYAEPVTLCHSEAHLLPRATPRQRCLGSVLEVSPTPALLQERTDFFGNRVSAFTVQASHDELVVSARSELELVQPELPLLEAASPAWDAVAAGLPDALDAEALEARHYVLPSRCVPVLPAARAYAEPSFTLGRPLLEAVRELNARLHADFLYDSVATTVATPLAEVLEHRRGVCQDFAHLGIACLRAMGLPARYVSGYLETLPPPGQTKLLGADASHAWFAVYVPDLGWWDFDPTNDIVHCGRHVTLAWGRDYADVTPLKGVVVGGGAHELDVAVDVLRGETGAG